MSVRLVQRGRVKSKQVAGGVLTVSVPLMNNYAAQWVGLVDVMHDQTLRALVAGVYPTMDAPTIFESMFDTLLRRFTVMFAGAGLQMAPKQIMAVNEESVRDLGMSLKDVSKFITIRPDVFSGPMEHTIQAAISKNVNLISRIPAEYLGKVKQDVESSLRPGGGGLQTLVPAMEARYGEAKNWAHHVALDQTRKAYTDINAQRCVDSGIEEAEWIHTMGSSHPRHYHMMRAPVGLNGLIFRLSEPPIIDMKTGVRGLPGHAIFCRCAMRPIANMARFLNK